jgi:hypothetical protein
MKKKEPEVAVLLSGGTYEERVPREPDLRFEAGSDGRLREKPFPREGKKYVLERSVRAAPNTFRWKRRHPPIWEERDAGPEEPIVGFDVAVDDPKKPDVL